MKNYWYTFLVGLVLITITSCGTTTSKNESAASQVIEEPQNLPVILGVLESTNLYSEPSYTSTKLINKKATEALGETYYLSIDESCRVLILEETETWCKIQVTTPDWLRNSHIGWCEKKFIEYKNEEKNVIVELGKDYSVLDSVYLSGCYNVYIHYKGKIEDKTQMSKVAKFLHNKYSKGKCNIHIYDTDKLGDLMHKYPLNNKEYLNVADHFVYTYSFDEIGFYYPFQDIRYKELGGKNWKKEPIK